MTKGGQPVPSNIFFDVTKIIKKIILFMEHLSAS